MNKLTKLSLRTKIIGLVLFANCIVGIGGIYGFNQFGAKFESNLHHHQAEIAKSLGQKIAAQFYERYGDIQAFALNPLAHELNSKKLPTALDEYVKLYGIYDVILVVDKNGKYVASNTKDSSDKPINANELSAKSYASMPWFKAVIEKRYSEDKAKGFVGTYFEDMHIDPIYNYALGLKDRTGVSFSAPITNDNGEIIGVITNRVNNKWFETEMVSIFEASGSPSDEVTLINKEGLVIANLSPKFHGGKMEFDHDTEKVLLKENITIAHMPVGKLILDHQSGAIISKDISDSVEDLVGYFFIDDAKWLNSIGWTAMVHIDAKEALAPVSNAKNNFYLVSAMIFFICISLSVWLSITIAKGIDQITHTLSKSSQEVSSAANKIATQATQLSESSTEQAAALQETVAAVDEINAMVKINSDSANKSKEVSSQSRLAAQSGQQTVNEMQAAMSEISSSNQEISDQMSDSTRKISDITNLISDIGAKTKVINEIVFQTKLLSFNASVEAARAGEYGKGFAVVAEEVGNLARMSGTAAKEITDMLEQSTRQVQSIVAETKDRLERIMAVSKQKVSIGTEKTEDCRRALNEILENVESVDSIVSEIATASNEQSQGIQEISKAVGQLETVTQQNSLFAQASSVSVEQLNGQATTLNDAVLDLIEITKGDDSPVKDNFTHSSPSPIISLAGRKKKHKTSHKNHSSEAEASSSDNSLRKVSGADYIPSANDPGFKE